MPPVDPEPLLPRVTRPARYSGGEWNADRRSWEEASLHVLLTYPDVYEVGMASPAVHSLYALLNARPSVLCERLFAPWPDLAMALRELRLPLWSLETRHAPGEFHALLVWLPHELSYTTVLDVLDLGGISLEAQQREQGPLVLAAGPAAANPEPLADFVDLFLLGDAEAVLPDLLPLLERWAAGGAERRPLLREAAQVPGVYVPSLYAPREGGGLAPLEGAPARPRFRWAVPLPPAPTAPVVPFVETVRDGVELELARGGDRLAEGGYLGPYRERPQEEVLAAAREALVNTGHRELFLSGEPAYPPRQLVQSLRQSLPPEVAVRLGPLPPREEWLAAAATAAHGQPTGALTLRLAAASERLRAALGEPMTDAEVARLADEAYARGWTSLRLQVTVGLPGEERDDLTALVALAQEVRRRGRFHHGGRAHARVEASLFVPRPWTPFQWAAQRELPYLEEAASFLRNALKKGGVELSCERPERALLAATLARGDRRLGAAVRRAWELGARLETRREAFVWAVWERALAEAGLAAEAYAGRERAQDELLPWGHLDAGPDMAALWRRWQELRATLSPQG